MLLKVFTGRLIFDSNNEKDMMISLVSAKGLPPEKMINKSPMKGKHFERVSNEWQLIHVRYFLVLIIMCFIQHMFD